MAPIRVEVSTASRIEVTGADAPVRVTGAAGAIRVGVQAVGAPGRDADTFTLGWTDLSAAPAWWRPTAARPHPTS